MNFFSIAYLISVFFSYFKGWSERLELQEQYADIREERMEELTDSLVSCMTGNLFNFPRHILNFK